MAYTTKSVENIRAAIGTPHENSQSPVTMTASIGIARFPDDAAEAATLVEQARLAMHAAKREGGDRVCFYADVGTKSEP
jgi:GGDEF domain-containing protein